MELWFKHTLPLLLDLEFLSSKEKTFLAICNGFQSLAHEVESREECEERAKGPLSILRCCCSNRCLSLGWPGYCARCYRNPYGAKRNWSCVHKFRGKVLPSRIVFKDLSKALQTQPNRSIPHAPRTALDRMLFMIFYVTLS